MSTFTLLFPRIRNMVGVLACLAILSACTDASISTETPSPTPPHWTQTVWPTVTPEHPVPYLIPVEDVGEQYGSLFEISPDFQRLSAGTYLIAEAYSRDVLYYFSIDGARFGEVGSILRPAPPYDYRLSFSSITTDFIGPSFLKIYSNDWFGLSNNDIGSGMVLVQNVDLSDGDTNIWQATLQTDDEMLCLMGFWSPDRRWYYGNCWMRGENYIYLLDLLSGSGRYLYSSQHPCRTAQLSYSEGWTTIGFDENGTSMQAYCRDSERGFYMHCSISLDSGVFSCTQADYDQSDFHFYPYSPDGSKVVASVYPNGEEKLSYLFITDRECIVDSASCTEYIRAPIGDGVSLYYEVGMAWDQTGSRFIWSTVPMTADKIKPFSKINIADIETGEVRSFDGPRGAVLLGLSPDDRWMVLVDFNDLMLLSMNGQTLRRLPRPGDQPASFLGWLVIP